MSRKGWVCVDRSIQDHWVWDCEYSYGQAWIDLILGANHSDAKVMIKGQIVSLRRGQQARSEVTLSNQWKWSRNKVRRFLKNLENDNMIIVDATHLTSFITICNYSDFQSYETADGTTEGQQTEQQKDSRRNTNNNDNNGNNGEGSSSEPKATSKKRSRKKPVTDFPENFEVTPEMADWFFEQQFDERLDLGRATQKWADAMRAKGNQYADWKRAWMTGMRNANEWLGSR